MTLLLSAGNGLGFKERAAIGERDLVKCSWTSGVKRYGFVTASKNLPCMIQKHVVERDLRTSAFVMTKSIPLLKLHS